jgi:MazG family protein
MEAFNQISEILDRLLAPDGCPWDREQTMETLRSTVLEEVCELIESINLQDDAHIQEELGDLFLNAIFFCKIAEKEKRFTMHAVLEELAHKLIRRHPHVFGTTEVADINAVLNQWEAIKSDEMRNRKRVSSLDGIPKELPALALGQKMAKKIAKTAFQTPEKTNSQFSNEESLGEVLLSIVNQAQKQGLDAEQALRNRLAHYEQAFRHWEKHEKHSHNKS